MEITEVKVFPVREEKLKAFVSIVIDDCFMVNDIKVIQGRETRFISMPSRRKKSGEFKDVAHPLDNGTRQMLEARILAEYEAVLAEREEGAGQARGSDEAPRRRRRRRRSRKPGKPDMAAAAGAVAGGPSPGASSEEAAPAESQAAEVEADENASLEEVAEKHLSDSFWTT